jgi:hypothetical protein
MRKLIPFNGNSFSFYKDVVASKRNSANDPNYKTRLGSMEALVEPLFQNYENRFADNRLELLMAQTLTNTQKADLLRLYSYGSSILQKLKIKLTTIGVNKVLNTCQCCTIGEVGSFDHMVPQEEFPEFSVNPKNLFPSCSICNSYKNDLWRVGGNRSFLNLFLDDLPQVQYLLVDLEDPAGVVRPNFRLQNNNGINAPTFQLISNHFSRLHLLDRFRLSSDSVITPVINAIKAGKDGALTKLQIADQIRRTSEGNRISYGFNYWKSILELALASNGDFIDAIYDSN